MTTIMGKRTKTDDKEPDLEIPEAKKIHIDENGSSSEKKFNFKITSWNVDGLRAWLKKDGMHIFKQEDPDIVCLQEVKCPFVKLPAEIKNVKGYYSHFTEPPKQGYAGVGFLSKKEPLKFTSGIGDNDKENDGRCITAEYDDFYVVSAYVTNSGRKLVNLEKRMTWDEQLKKYLNELNVLKPVIYCGDLNVAHLEIDLANPKSNRRNAGFTKEERDNFGDLLSNGYVDTFRHLYPKKEKQYSFWSYFCNSREKNVGWRLDYFVVSKKLLENVIDNVMHTSSKGSDHCPISLLMQF